MLMDEEKRNKLEEMIGQGASAETIAFALGLDKEFANRRIQEIEDQKGLRPR